MCISLHCICLTVEVTFLKWVFIHNMFCETEMFSKKVSLFSGHSRLELNPSSFIFLVKMSKRSIQEETQELCLQTSVRTSVTSWCHNNTVASLSHALSTGLVTKILIALMYKCRGGWSGLLELTNQSRLGYSGGRAFKRSSKRMLIQRINRGAAATDSMRNIMCFLTLEHIKKTLGGIEIKVWTSKWAWYGTFIIIICSRSELLLLILWVHFANKTYLFLL